MPGHIRIYSQSTLNSTTWYMNLLSSQVPEVPEKLRTRDHMGQILHLDAETEEIEQVLSKTVESTLKELKKLYDAAIKPLEILYKYRDLSNRHFGGKCLYVFFFFFYF